MGRDEKWKPCRAAMYNKMSEKKGMRTEEKRTGKGGKVRTESIRCTTGPFHSAGVAVATVSVLAWGWRGGWRSHDGAGAAVAVMSAEGREKRY